MPEAYEYWEPNDWEAYVFGLLQDRHGPLNVYKVPARHKGDHGLDYYCLADRVTYQCFAVQEPCDVSDRASKQKAKITADLGKFCTKQSELKSLLGSVQITRWVLVVPLHDSAQVNAHATKKTQEVRALRLPYVSPDFEVMIQDLDSFDSRSRGSRMLQLHSVSLPRVPPSQGQIEEWCVVSNDLVRTLARKLAKRAAGQTAVDFDALVNEAIGWFLEREEALESIRERARALPAG